MRFDPQSLDDAMLSTLRRSGCSEILFGIESTNPATLKSMRKGLKFCRDQAIKIIERMGRHGIDAVINLIFAFPTESDAEFENSTLRFAEETAPLTHVILILNRFTLFRDTVIEQEPRSFGIVSTQASSNPLRNDREFVDVHGRDSRMPHPNETKWRRAIERKLCVDEDVVASESLFRYVNCSSIGLLWRWRTGGRFMQEIINKDGAPHRVFVSTGGVERDELVLGCNSYIGQNLALAIDPKRVILSSGSPRHGPSTVIDAPFIRADLARSPQPLAAVSPRVVYVVARPIGEFACQATFATHLKTLLHSWVTLGLERIVFLSTQLVYATPRDATPLATTAPTEPVETYEYFKTEIENFLRYLTAPRLSAEVFRLPLVYGGVLRTEQRRNQLVYAWVDQLVAGDCWRFLTDADRTFGNSWVLMDDLVASLLTSRPPGFHLRQPVSGQFTYFSWRMLLKKLCHGPCGPLQNRRFRSCRR